jgi:hypothetical protein
MIVRVDIRLNVIIGAHDRDSDEKKFPVRDAAAIDRSRSTRDFRRVDRRGGELSHALTGGT